MKPVPLGHACSFTSYTIKGPYEKQATEDDIRATLFGHWCRGCERMIDGPYQGKKIEAAQFYSALEAQ